MNKLPLQKRVLILSMLCEGSSMRSISRVADVSINTITKLLIDAGVACEEFHNRTVANVRVQNLQADEIWAFCMAKRRNVQDMKKPSMDAGDVWTFTSMDRDSKLMISWYSGERDGRNARTFLEDTAARIVGPTQVTTDGFPAYRELISEIFPLDASYGQISKVFSTTPDNGPGRRYSPGVCVGATKDVIFGNADKAKISTSHIERQNLNIRMGLRRFTRLTNGFSKKLENHAHALALYFTFYNFVRIHKTLKMTPAMAAGVTDKLMSLEDIVALIDAREEAPKKRGSYKKKAIP